MFQRLCTDPLACSQRQASHRLHALLLNQAPAELQKPLQEGQLPWPNQLSMVMEHY
jgi:hypothetical protein